MTDSTALSLPERAKAALQSAANDVALTELAERSKSIIEIRDAASYQQCHGARMALKSQRIAIEKIGKSAREDATAFSKAVIIEQSRLVGMIEPEERRLETLQTAWDDARAAEKRAKEEAERLRVGEIQRRLVKLESLGSGELYTSVLAPERLLDILQQLEAPPVFDYAEFSERATALRQAAIVAIRQAHVEALERIERENAERAAREAEEVRKAAERQAEEQRLAEVRRKLDAEQAEQQRAAEARRQEEERVATIRQRIRALNGPAHLVATDSPSLIKIELERIQQAPLDDTYEEFIGEAMRAKSAGIDRLSALLEAAEVHRAEQARIAAEREELARQQREQAERQAKIERKEREAAEAEDRRKAEIKAELDRKAAIAVQEREAEERRTKLRERISQLQAWEIVDIVAQELGTDGPTIAARIVEIPREDWAALTMSDAQEAAA